MKLTREADNMNVHLDKPIETSTDTSLAPYDWKHWGGGACPVPMGTRVCIRFRDNSVFNNCDSAGIGWDHIGSSNGDIVAYRVESFAAESGISSLDRRPNEQNAVADALDFEPDAQHSIADMANVGYSLMQAIKLHCPTYSWNDSPAEIVGDLLEKVGSQEGK